MVVHTFCRAQGQTSTVNEAGGLLLGLPFAPVQPFQKNCFKIPIKERLKEINGNNLPAPFVLLVPLNPSAMNTESKAQ